MPTRRVAIYTRISVSLEESVSLARQVEAAEQYAKARGWDVVATFVDDGVSATRNRPEDRAAWRALLGSPDKFDAVIVWKIDRLARSTLDFLHADQALSQRGAGVVAVEQSIDMTSAEGRGFATMLAVFGEMEAAAISARVAAARDYLIRQGRVVGGKIPYGWRSVPNPNGKGLVLAQDPDTIGWVRGMVDRALTGDTVYSITQWLDADGAPTPTGKGAWRYSTVERILRHPVLAGMTPHNPGSKDRVRGEEVLRDETGLPVIDESVAVVDTATRRRLITVLDGRDSPQARPRASKNITSPLLSGLVHCGECDVVMTRGTNTGRATLTCPRCHQSVSRPQLDPYLVQRLMAERGDRTRYLVSTETPAESSPALADIEQALADTSRRLTEDGADMTTLVGRIEALKVLRTDARAERPQTRWQVTQTTVREAWERAAGDLQRREVLADELGRIEVRRGGVGRRLDTSRVRIEWRADLLQEGPIVYQPFDDSDLDGFTNPALLG